MKLPSFANIFRVQNAPTQPPAPLIDGAPAHAPAPSVGAVPPVIVPMAPDAQQAPPSTVQVPVRHDGAQPAMPPAVAPLLVNAQQAPPPPVHPVPVESAAAAPTVAPAAQTYTAPDGPLALHRKNDGSLEVVRMVTLEVYPDVDPNYDGPTLVVMTPKDIQAQERRIQSMKTVKSCKNVDRIVEHIGHAPLQLRMLATVSGYASYGSHGFFYPMKELQKRAYVVHYTDNCYYISTRFLLR